MVDLNDSIKLLNEQFDNNSKEQLNDKEYYISYSMLLLKITANFISLGRALCKTHESKEVAEGVEKWFFDDQMNRYVNDLSQAIYCSKHLTPDPSHLRFIIARLATYPVFLSAIFRDKNDPDSTDPNIIERDLINKVKNNMPII